MLLRPSRVLVLLLVLFVPCRGGAAPPGGALLSRPVRLPAGWTTLGQLLAVASRQSAVPISYSSSVVPLGARVLVPSGVARPLGDVLYLAVRAYHVSFGELNGQVVLWPTRVGTPAGVSYVNSRGLPPPAAPAGSTAPSPGPARRAVAPSLPPLVPGAVQRVRPNEAPRVASSRSQAQLSKAQPADSALALRPLRARVVPLAGRVGSFVPPLLVGLPAGALVPPPPLRRRTWQLGLVYPISTNGRANARTSNAFSLNGLVGYAGGVRKVEVGGLVNVVRDTVRGVQVAGVANVTGTAVRGVQLAQWANVVGGEVRGVQGAFLNVVRDDVRGVQFSLLNVVGGATHARRSASRPTRVRRWLGLPRRLATDSVARRPDAPTANAPGRLVQTALVANITGTDVRGLQSASILNLAHRVKGVQFGLVNVARHVQGVQIGLINVADSVDGVALGLLNVVRHGYLRGEVWTSESLPLNGVLKLGVRRYYTLLGAAAEPFGDQVMWATGVGVGTASRPHGRFTYSVDVLHWFLAGSVKTAGRPNQYGLLILRPAVAWQLEQQGRLQLVVAPTLNYGYARSFDNLPPEWNMGSNQYLLLDHAGPASLDRLWLGAQLGLRF